MKAPKLEDEWLTFNVQVLEENLADADGLHPSLSTLRITRCDHQTVCAANLIRSLTHVRSQAPDDRGDLDPLRFP